MGTNLFFPAGTEFTDPDINIFAQEAIDNVMREVSLHDNELDFDVATSPQIEGMKEAISWLETVTLGEIEKIGTGCYSSPSQKAEKGQSGSGEGHKILNSSVSEIIRKTLMTDKYLQATPENREFEHGFYIAVCLACEGLFETNVSLGVSHFQRADAPSSNDSKLSEV